MKYSRILTEGETLFRDETVFTPSYMPKDFIHRDSQMQEIMYSLKPGTRGLNPVNTFLYGPPATGKTTAVLYAFQQLKEATGKLLPVYINCEDHNTPYTIFAKIYHTVYGINPPSTGKPLEDLKEAVYHKLKKEDKSLIVALDEADSLKEEGVIDKVLIDLLKAHTSYGFDRVGVMAVTTKKEVLALLDEKTRSVYNPKTIYFPKYSRNEIRDILNNRIKYGLYDKVLDEECLEDIVDKTLNTGDLRTGIDLIRRSVHEAEKDSSRKVSLEHIEKAYKVLPDLRMKEVEDTVSEDEKIFLQLVKESPGDSSGNLYRKMREKTGCGVRRFNEIISKLERKGIIVAEYRQGVRGRSREIRIL